jgi:SAM-dependent methyltransferase
MSDPLQTNATHYADIYGRRQTFLRYPADWIIRFHNIYLRENIPRGRVLDFGCGSGNNMKFFLDQGYDVTGTDIVDDVVPLVRENLGNKGVVQILPPNIERLPFADGSFDVVLSNQVLYYLASRQRIEAMSREFARVLRPGGAVFITMMGLRNYYCSGKLARNLGDDVYEVVIEGANRLSGFHQVIYAVRDDEHLRDLFGNFEPLTTGYVDQSLFDLKSSFHWIFAGRKA